MNEPTINVNVRLTGAVPALLHRIVDLLYIMNGKENSIMASIDQVLQDVNDETTLVNGVSTLITGLKEQLAEALSGHNLPADVQAKVDQVFAAAEANKAKLSAALAANTLAAPASPAPETPTPTPPPETNDGSGTSGASGANTTVSPSPETPPAETNPAPGSNAADANLFGSTTANANLSGSNAGSST